MTGTSGNRFSYAPVASRLLSHLVEYCENGQRLEIPFFFLLVSLISEKPRKFPGKFPGKFMEFFRKLPRKFLRNFPETSRKISGKFPEMAL